MIVKLSKKSEIITLLVLVALALAGFGGYTYWKTVSARVYVEKAQVLAPVVNLAPKAAGALQETFANVGDYVQMNAPIARVGNELIKAKADGVVLSLNTNIGAGFAQGQAVATMANPNDLRVVGQVQEDKGLKDIKVGQAVIFTIDAFGSKEYVGVVDEISPTARAGDIVFNISDKRQENSFDVKVRYDVAKYPELKNGMSAKLWIYK